MCVGNVEDEKGKACGLAALRGRTCGPVALGTNKAMNTARQSCR